MACARNELHYGYPDDGAANFGPVVSDEHRDKVVSYDKLAEEEGAKVPPRSYDPHSGARAVPVTARRWVRDQLRSVIS